jgi:hypothetical protein
MRTVSHLPSIECKYYLRGAARLAAIGTATLLTVTVIVFADFIFDLRVSLRELFRHPFGGAGNGHIGHNLQALWGIVPYLGVAVALIVIWRFTIGPHVVLDDEALWGIRISRRRMGVHFSFAGIYYYEIGSVSEGQVLGLKFKRYYSRDDPCVSIIVPFGISGARECFQLLDQRVTSPNPSLNAPY